MDSGKLEYWRNFFRGAKSSMIEIIESAVMVASLDCPDELKLRRDRISEKLYCSHWSDVFRADQTKLVLPKKENCDDFPDSKSDRDGSKVEERDYKKRLVVNGGKVEKIDCKNGLVVNGGKLKDRDCNNGLVLNSAKLEDRDCRNGLVVNGVELQDRDCKKKLALNGGKKVEDRECKNGLVVNGCKLEDKDCKKRFVVNGGKLEGGGTLETKVEDSNKNEIGDMSLTPVSMISDLEAEALADEIDEENLIVAEVLRIKEILLNFEEQSISMLLECLRKLQLMTLSYDILKATEIGKVVNSLYKHGPAQSCQLARTIVKDWKKVANEWLNATLLAEADIANPVTPSLVDNELDDGLGLALPPLDVGAFFTNPICSMELSQFFDGMDDYEKPRISAELNKNHDNEKKHSPVKHDISKKKSKLSKEANVIVKDMGLSKEVNVVVKDTNVAMKKESVVKVPKEPKNESGSGKLLKQNLDERLKDKTKFHQNSDRVVIRKRPLTGENDFSDKSVIEEKLESTRRKLKVSKQQRTIQVMDLHELPKQLLGHRNTHM
ncbi:unnamed protein product [Camellia sinensis]